jgi:hypothetical protein
VKLKLCATCGLLSLWFAVAATSSSRQLPSFEQKLDHIEANGRSPHPDHTPTIVTEREVNAYLMSDNLRLPAGVESVNLEGQDGVITGKAQVDFDRIREGTHSSNPLLSVFTGVHNAVVVARAHGHGGTGYVHLDSLSLDDFEVPRFVLRLFIQKFLQPKYPEIDLDSQFALPDRIDTASVGEHELTITQK